MVVSTDTHDWVIMKRVNQDLGVPEETQFEATKESFKKFVQLLSVAKNINPHFDTAYNVCYMSEVSYRCVPGRL